MNIAELADVLAGCASNMPEGVTTISIDVFGKPEIHVNNDTFDGLVQPDTVVEYDDWPQHNKVKESFITDSGCTIFALKTATFERVA